jgi:hypothetical protein
MINIQTSNNIDIDYYNFVVLSQNKDTWDVTTNIDGLKKKIISESKTVRNKDDLKFINFLQKRLKTIVKGDINRLKKIQYIIEVNHKKVWKKIKSYNESAPKGKKRKFIYTILKKIFITYGYENIISKEIAYKILKKIDVKVCPYCNINYISFSGTNDNKGIRPELDHFYPKSHYPYFAVSFYNLIPSCRNCNALKSNSFSKELKSPYAISKNNDDFKFKYIAKNINILSTNLNNIEKGIDKITFQKKIVANNKMFHLEDLYQVHKDVVAEIIWKNRNFPNALKDSYRSFGITKKEAYRIIFCNYSDANEFNKRPLSKLTYDIQKYF